jgi:hypothetical protein
MPPAEGELNEKEERVGEGVRERKLEAMVALPPFPSHLHDFWNDEGLG